MPIQTHTNIHSRTGGGNIFYDKRFDLLWKVAKEQDVSQEAKRRLRWFDYHTKVKNAALTCRYFGISESCFWKWKKLYAIGGLNGLEDRSRRPNRVRRPETAKELIGEIGQLRRLFPRYGKEKIRRLLKEKISISSVGRVISRYNMFYRKRYKKYAARWQGRQRQRIKNLWDCATECW